MTSVIGHVIGHVATVRVAVAAADHATLDLFLGESPVAIAM